MTTKTIEVSSIPFRESVNAFVAELIQHLQAERNYPISQIFYKLPLNPDNQETQDAIVQRGELQVTPNTISNEGDLIVAAFNDSEVGSVQIILPESIQAQFTISSDTLLLSFKAIPIPVRIYGQQFKLYQLTFSPTAVTYLFVEKGNEENQVLLIAKLVASVGLANHEDQHHLASLTGWALYEYLFNQFALDGCCGCGSVSTEASDGWAIWKSSNGFCQIAHSTRDPIDSSEVMISGTYQFYQDASDELHQLTRSGICK